MAIPDQEQRKTLLFLRHFAPFGPSVDHTAVRADLLTQPTEPNANLLWKRPPRHTQKVRVTSYQGTL